LLVLSLASCSDNAPDAPDTPKVTTDSLDTTTPDSTSDTTETVTNETTAPPEELPVTQREFFTPDDQALSDLALSAYRNEILLEDFLSDRSVQNFIAQNLSEIFDTDISRGDFDVHIVEIGTVYPMTIVLSVYDRYDTMINFSTFEEGKFRYSNPYKLYGRYEADNLMSAGQPEYIHINKADMENAVLEANVDDITIKYGAVSVSETDRTITVPILSGTEPYAAVLKIENDLTYTLESFQKLDFSSMTVYDFLVTYEAFGIEPFDLVLNDYGIPLSPENAITDVLGAVDALESMYVNSEFSYSPYIRVRTMTQAANEPEIDVSFYLVDKLTGEKVNTVQLSPDAKFEDFVWKN